MLRVSEPLPEMEVLMKARIDDWLLSSLASQWSCHDPQMQADMQDLSY